MDFLKQITSEGWCQFENFVPQDLVRRMLVDLESAYKVCCEIQIENGLHDTEGTCHHLIGQGDSFTDYLVLFEGLNEYVEQYFGGKYILNSFGGNLLTKGASYANNIHREIRSYSGTLPLMLNTLVMLDDFTFDNGATWLMRRGHFHSDKPTEQEFMKQAFQITGRAGDVVMWNSNLWHKAGENKTNRMRRSVTPEFTRPFMKQGFDYTQFCDDKSSPWIKQVLGWNSRVPQTLEQWYQPKENRWYKGDQG